MMPGCVLRVQGTSFDPDAFLAGSRLVAYRVWHPDQPLAKTGRRALKVHSDGGFCSDVSRIDGNLAGQVADAETFLTEYQPDLRRLADSEAVESLELDFGHNCRLGENVFVQCERLPVSFLKLVGLFRIEIALSLYLTLDSD